MATLFTIPAITAIIRMIDGYSEGGIGLGLSIGTHARLGDFFGSAGLETVEEASIAKKTRATVKQANERREQHDALKHVVEQIADLREYWTDTERHTRTIAHLNDQLRSDGFELRQLGDKWRLMPLTSSGVVAEQLHAKVARLSFDSVRQDFDRALSQTDRDPADALTSACATVESVCKCLLDELGKPYPPKQDIQHLSNTVADHLGLSPARTDLPPGLAMDLRQVLGGLQSVAGGIGALRTHFGDAHGRGKAKAPVDARIARLAIHAASTLSLFYIETWQKTAQREKKE